MPTHGRQSVQQFQRREGDLSEAVETGFGQHVDQMRAIARLVQPLRKRGRR